jgi:hypothetical protein
MTKKEWRAWVSGEAQPNQREQARNQRAERVCRELRYQLAENRWDGDRLAKLLGSWMNVAKKNKYTRP